MPLSRDSWVHKAARLKHGERVRTEHDCGSGRVLLIRKDDQGQHAWCFRCNDGDWVPPEPLPLAERLARLTAMAAADNSQSRIPTVLPLPAVPWAEWPAYARLWFLKAGLSSHDAGVMRGYYHPPTDRVVLPVFHGSELVFWQARAVQPGRVPKYLAPDQPATGVLPRWGEAPSVTLVEDLLSCYKVGSTQGCEAWCLMGTSLKSNMLAELLRAGKPVNVWLDPDAAGKRAASKIAKQLRAVGLTVNTITSERDPKLLHRAAIKELLCTSSK